MRLGVVGHRGYPELPELVAALMRVAGRLRMSVAFEEDVYGVAQEASREGATLLTDPAQIDALLTLGGDGTLLRGARWLNGRTVPVLGINLGRVGFLTAAGRDELEPAIERLNSGEYRAEGRMVLEAATLGAHDPRRWFALNDIVLHKGGFARVMRLRIDMNGEPICNFAADGVIVSTPTGSTAYSLSAGGPVVEPSLESIVIAPISPHTLAIRPIVLPPSAQITIHTDAGYGERMVTVDGQVGMTFLGVDALNVRRAEHAVLLVRFPEATFFSRLSKKMGWGGPGSPDE